MNSEPFSYKVLDHGYVKLIPKGTWGSDETIIESARMSTDGGFVSWDPYPGHPKGDQGLLSFLWNHKHMTPFEMAGATFEIQAPIMVFREWHRHRTQSYNEMSGRYTELPNLYYIPSVERLMAGKQSQTNHQSSQDGFTEADAFRLRGDLIYATQKSREAYQRLLEVGLSRELARLVIPVNQYSRMRASANLRNWLGFLTLRLDPASQWEIRQYAEAVASVIAKLFPRTWKLFNSDRQGLSGISCGNSKEK